VHNRMVYAIAVSFVVSAFFLTFSRVSADSEVHKIRYGTYHRNVRHKLCALNKPTNYQTNLLEFDAVIKMVEGPPLAPFRRSKQTAPRCFPGDRTVLNGWGKGVEPRQVRIEKMNENEPLMKCRENAPSVKTYGSLYIGKSAADNLIYRLHDRRHERGMSSIQA
jgi:hypothetical protein